MRIMTFNIRFSGGKDKHNCWDNRKTLILEIIQKYEPDIVGFQEAMRNQVDYLVEHLNEYQAFGNLPEQGNINSEYNPIFFRNVKLIDSGVFWLSKTPNKPSNSWSRVPRVCVWIKVKSELPTQNNSINIIVLNIHLDVWQRSRFKSFPILKEFIQKPENNLPLFLMGDLNFPPDSKEYKVMASLLKDSFDTCEKIGCLANMANITKNELNTYHDFKGITYEFKKKRSLMQRIDYIWHTPNIHVLQYDIIHDYPKNQNQPSLQIYPSDHWPVFIDFELR